MSRSPIVVYCDFDGTVTQGDVTDLLLSELADPSWRLVEAKWEQGLIGSRECLARQIPLMQGGWKAIEAQLRHVKLDPSFAPFARWCAARMIPLRIVSDGVDRVIETLLAREGITVGAVYANHLLESASGELSLVFPYPSVQLACNAGLCKCERVDGGPEAPLRIVIGDGRSDRCWAARADRVFAKSELLTYCCTQAIPCAPFADFHDVRRAIALLQDLSTRRFSTPIGAGCPMNGSMDA